MIDVGGGTTEVAVIALNGIVVGASVRVGGNRIDDEIANYMKRKYSLMVGDRTAEEIKITIGSAIRTEDNAAMEVRGRDQVSGLPRTVTVHSHEVTDAMRDPLNSILGAVQTVLEDTPPELASDIIDKGMVLTGGGALLRNLDQLLSGATGVPCTVAENPLNCVAIGTGIALEHLDILRDSLSDE